MNTRSIPRDHVRAKLYDITSDLMVQTDGACRSCISCHNFDEKTELCKLYQQRPPARVIAMACESYEDIDEIPF